MGNRSFLRLNKKEFIELDKAVNHKYVRREPDGKGGWIYYYKITTYSNNNFSPDNLKRINYFIENIRDKKIEHSGSYDDKGNLILYKKGREKRIVYTSEELKRMTNSTLLIHNHPEGGAFSIGDVKTIIDINVKESIISTVEFNKKINYSLKLLRNPSEKEKEKIIEEYQKSYYFIFDKFDTEIRKGKRTTKEAEEGFSNDLMIDFTNKFKDIFNYEKRKNL